MMLVKGGYKLSRYADNEITGGQTYYELFDIQNDPDELNDLIDTEPNTASAMIEEIEAIFQGITQPNANT